MMGDANSKVGKTDIISPAHGSFGLGMQNESGKGFIEFILENNLIITNIIFQQHPRRLYTWMSPSNQVRNQIDYILIQ